MGQPIVRYESGQTAHAFEEMSDGGDNTTFGASFAPLSQATGHAPTVAPYGLKTGGAITPGSSNDEVDVAALTVVAPGMTGADADGVVSVSADTVSITRGLSSDTHNITSITVNSSGAMAAVSGTDGTAFSETRGAAGGPPLIPVGSVEIGQVRTTSVTAAIVLAGEIFQSPGLHLERYDYPTYTVDYVTGEITFNEALPLIHTGGVPKKVYIKGSTPLFSPVGYTADWTPAQASKSSSSESTYDGPVNSFTDSLGQASFSAKVDNPISAALEQLTSENLWFEYRHDRDASIPKQLTQGYLSSSWSSQAGGGKVSVSYTISASVATRNVIA